MSPPLDESEQSLPPLKHSTPDPAPAGAEITSIPAPLAITNKISSDEEPNSGPQVLDLGEGNVVKLDRLGPMIINSDGTLSRIQNWQDLHPIEQERTVRLLVKKRNLVRLQKLDAEEQAQAGGEKLSALTDASEMDTKRPQ